jgi:hypothetical protein
MNATLIYPETVTKMEPEKFSPGVASATDVDGFQQFIQEVKHLC